MRLIYFLAIISIVAVSCNKESNADIQQIKKLEKQVDSLTRVCNSIDFNHFREMSTEANVNVEFLKNNHSNLDMQNREVAKYVGAYGAFSKSLSRTFKKGASSLEGELELSKSQLKNLRYDIKKELISGDKVIKEYIESERKFVDRLNVLVNIVHGEFQKHEKDYALLKEPVDVLIKEVREKY